MRQEIFHAKIRSNWKFTVINYDEMYSKLSVEAKIEVMRVESLTADKKWGKGEKKRHLTSNCTAAENSYTIHMNALGNCIYVQTWENTSKGDRVRKEEARGYEWNYLVIIQRPHGLMEILERTED